MRDEETILLEKRKSLYDRIVKMEADGRRK